MKKRIITIAALTIVFASAIAFSSLPAGAETQSITITDDFGRTVTIHGVPERIISLSPTNTEILFAIGAGDRVVGVTEYCNYPEEAAEREKIGGVSTVSIEKVIALEPDLVLGDELNGKETFERLEALNITVFGLDPANISEILDDILLVGNVTGEEQNAASVVANLTGRLEEIRNETTDVERPRVFYNIGDFWTAGEETFINEIISIAGGENIAADTSGYFIMNIEELIAKNPEVIICDRGMGSISTAYEEITSDKRLQVVNAVKNDRIYVIEGDLMDRAGPRMIDAVEVIHEDLSDFSTNAEVEDGAGPTPSPTVSATVTPTPVVTPEEPGFDAASVIAGLCSVGYLILRRAKR
jgi:iron complex transport system substrate-binding protein